MNTPKQLEHLTRAACEILQDVECYCIPRDSGGSGEPCPRCYLRNALAPFLPTTKPITAPARPEHTTCKCPRCKPTTKPLTHTPGEWSVYTDTNDPEWVLIMAGGPAGRIIATVNTKSCPDISSAPAFVKMPALANANLISAAPDLLRALLMFVEQYEGNGHDEREARPEMIAARNAIAKAAPDVQQLANRP